MYTDQIQFSLSANQVACRHATCRVTLDLCLYTEELQTSVSGKKYIECFINVNVKLVYHKLYMLLLLNFFQLSPKILHNSKNIVLEDSKRM